MPLSSAILAQLKQADKLPHNPRPREFLQHAPKRALLIIVDGVTPNAMKHARTPTFDALNARGVFGTDARTIFPTITGPAHTSLLTGARVGTHGFLYPKMLDAFGNRLLDFTEGLMQAETIAEACRPRGLVSVGIGSRFLRGADALITEGIVGEDMDDITNRAIAALRDWEPHFLMVVYYAADTMGHLFGPEADETLAAIEEIDARVQKILTAYDDKNFLDDTIIVVAADHGMAEVKQVVAPEFIARVNGLPHGRLAFTPSKLSEKAISALMNDEQVEDVWSQDELDLLGASNPRWGKHIIHLKEGLMFPHAREMLGYHGAWSRTEQHVPLIFSGAGIRANARLETCEVIDIAPTLSLLLGGDVPQNAEGRVLWEILDMENNPPVADYQRLIRERDDLLNEAKQLRRDYSAHGIARADFVAQQKDWKHRAEKKSAGLKRLQKMLIALPNK